MAERVPLVKDAFTETAEGGKLVGNKCKKCGQVFFPKARTCLNCFNEDMEDVVLSRRGKLYSYTIGRMPSMHFWPPYCLGFMDIPEGVRIFGPLKVEESEYGQLKIGMDVSLVIEKLWQEDDKEIIGWKFEPVLEGGK
jgi:uncharacterized OB-fold protein